MPKAKLLLTAVVVAALTTPAIAQYTGPSAAGSTASATVAEAENARIGTYMSLTGNIVEHLRADYYRFEDETGTIRVEIQPGVFAGQEVGPETMVSLSGEIDCRVGVGPQYLWVNSLTIVEDEMMEEEAASE